MDLTPIISDDVVDALLVVLSAAVLAVVVLFLIWASYLRRRVGSQPGHSILRLLVAFGWISCVVQVIAFGTAILIAADRIGTIDLRAVLYVGQELCLLLATGWLFREVRRL